ncbi:MAG: murein hydrolase activator EnvC [Acidimicrobiales bacterium]
MTKTRLPAAALVFTVVMALAIPGFADSLDSRSAANAAKKAAAAAKLDAAKADDQALEGALRDLDTSVATQSSSVEAAQQAASVAQGAVGTAEAKLAATESRMSGLRAAASAMAVRSYVHPGGDALLGILGSTDLGAASVRQALLDHVASTDTDVLGQLRGTRQDEQAQQADLARLRDQAEARRQSAAAHLADLQKARADQARLKAALDGRISEYTAEVAALARDEASIENLIRSRQAPSAPSALGALGVGGGGGSAPASASGLIWPASGPITSPFGMRWGAMHTGIDIGAGYGTPIRAAKAGTVISTSSDASGYGNLTVIDHGGGFSTLYAHQSSFAVSGGATVAQGQVIGYVGCSGHCTGPHLHFETRVNGNPQNPLNFLP